MGDKTVPLKTNEGLSRSIKFWHIRNVRDDTTTKLAVINGDFTMNMWVCLDGMAKFSADSDRICAIKKPERPVKLCSVVNVGFLDGADVTMSDDPEGDDVDCDAEDELITTTKNSK